MRFGSGADRHRSMQMAMWAAIIVALVSAASVHSKTINPPVQTIDQAMHLATEYAGKRNIDLSRHFLASIEYQNLHSEYEKAFWRLEWRQLAGSTSKAIAFAVYPDNTVNLIGEEKEDAAVPRRHPGHQLEVTYVPVREQFGPGDPVEVRLRIRNVGTRQVSFMQGGRQRGARDNQFGFTAELNGKVVPDTGNSVNHGGLGQGVTIQPGAHLDIDVDLRKWFKFDEPGTYFIRGSYYMEHVYPGPGYTPIWEDFACAEFHVVIGGDVDEGPQN